MTTHAVYKSNFHTWTNYSCDPCYFKYFQLIYQIINIYIYKYSLCIPGSSNKDGEEGARTEAPQQDAGVAARARQRARGAEQPRVRGGAAREARGPGGTGSPTFFKNYEFLN